jgi:lysozyme family protein
MTREAMQRRLAAMIGGHMSPLERALGFTLRSDIEGGYYDGSGSHDPNPTMRGVTQRTYNEWRRDRGLPTREVKDIAPEEVRTIAAERYWLPAGCSRLPPDIAVAHFDAAYNMGPQAAIKCLQRACGVKDDGVFGPITETAARTVSVDAVLFARIDYYRRIVQAKRSLLPALVHWLYRVGALRAYLDTPAPRAA